MCSISHLCLISQQTRRESSRRASASWLFPFMSAKKQRVGKSDAGPPGDLAVGALAPAAPGALPGCPLLVGDQASSIDDIDTSIIMFYQYVIIGTKSAKRRCLNGYHQ